MDRQTDGQTEFANFNIDSKKGLSIGLSFVLAMRKNGTKTNSRGSGPVGIGPMGSRKPINF